MLKVFLGFLVSVVVLLSSAYVPQIVPAAYAASATVVMTHIQAGGVGAATQEFIVIYNAGDDEVDVTGWCLTNKNNVTIACFNPPITGQAYYLPAHHYSVIASASFAATLAPDTVTITYVPTSQSSGSITSSSDTVSLLDHPGAVIDRHSWTSSITAGMQFERRISGNPAVYQDTDTTVDWLITTPGTLPVDGIQIDTTIIDVCQNIDDIQGVVPYGYIVMSPGECTPRVTAKLVLTEIFPNAAGSDIGQEFVEIFNPNEEIIDLMHYKLLVGPNLENSYYFPAGSTIPAGGYRSFSNTDISFTLLNSSSRVSLSFAEDGTIVSESPTYIDPKDGQSWALIDDVWQYTDHPTAGAVNIAMSEEGIILALENSLQPCALNQYRSPETNRCRLLSSDAKTLTACKENEERNLETNRCRKIVIAAAAVPCKEGQERNSDTNRCRTITKMPNADYGVLGAKTGNDGNWYAIAAIGGVVILALGYAIWEWHGEIKNFFHTSCRRLLQFARAHK